MRAILVSSLIIFLSNFAQAATPVASGGDPTQGAALLMMVDEATQYPCETGSPGCRSDADRARLAQAISTYLSRNPQAASTPEGVKLQAAQKKLASWEVMKTSLQGCGGTEGLGGRVLSGASGQSYTPAPAMCTQNQNIVPQGLTETMKTVKKIVPVDPKADPDIPALADMEKRYPGRGQQVQDLFTMRKKIYQEGLKNSLRTYIDLQYKYVATTHAANDQKTLVTGAIKEMCYDKSGKQLCSNADLNMLMKEAVVDYANAKKTGRRSSLDVAKSYDAKFKELNVPLKKTRSMGCARREIDLSPQERAAYYKSKQGIRADLAPSLPQPGDPVALEEYQQQYQAFAQEGEGMLLFTDEMSHQSMKDSSFCPNLHETLPDPKDPAYGKELQKSAQKVVGAAQEALTKVKEHAQELHDTLHTKNGISVVDPEKQATNDLKVLVKHNIPATSKVLVDHPRLTSLMCYGPLKGIEQDEKNHERFKKAAMWGGMIIGIAIPVAGWAAGAYMGSAAVVGGITAAAEIGGATLSVASAGEAYRSHQEMKSAWNSAFSGNGDKGTIKDAKKAEADFREEMFNTVVSLGGGMAKATSVAKAKMFGTATKSLASSTKVEAAAGYEIGGIEAKVAAESTLESNIAKSSERKSAQFTEASKEKVTLQRAIGEDGAKKDFAYETHQINSNQLADGHPLKKMVQSLEKKGVKVVEYEDAGAANAPFDMTYLGKGDLVTASGSKTTSEIIAVRSGYLKNAETASVKKMLEHEVGHTKTFGNGGNSADFTNSITKTKDKGMELPFQVDGGSYDKFAAGDEARQYARQGMKELRVTKESEIQQKFKASEKLSMNEVFGDESKSRLVQASGSFKKSSSFAQMESNSYKKMSATLESSDQSTGDLLNHLGSDGKFKIEVKDSGTHFEKELALDPKKYPGLPQSSDELAALKQERVKLIHAEREKLIQDIGASPEELKDASIISYLDKNSVIEADAHLAKQHPWLKNFKQDLLNDFATREKQYQRTATQMKKSSETAYQLQYKSEITYEEYNALRKSVSDGTYSVLPGN